MKNTLAKIYTEYQKTNFMFNNLSPPLPPPPKSYRLKDNVEKYDTDGQATDGNIIRRTQFACRISKHAVTLSEYVIFIAFRLQK
jgi:hypothetical protein